MRAKLLLGSMFAVTAAACTVPPTPAPPATAPPTTAPTTTTTPPPPAPVVDYDPSDLVWFNADTNVWYRGDVGAAEILFEGEATDVAAPADYDGDGRTDIVFVRGGRWLRPDGTVIADLPAPPATLSDSYPAQAVPADYDGDGSAEPAWYRSDDATWWIDGQAPVVFGQGPTVPQPDRGTFDQDYPVPADYDGDGIVDLATYSPRTGAWRLRSSEDATVSTTVLRAPDGRVTFPVPGDYDGVGHAQRALLDDRGWLIEGHASVEALDPAHSAPAMVILPAVADYDGDGRVERSYLDWTGAGDKFWRFAGSTAELQLGSQGDSTVPATTTFYPVINVARFAMLSRCAIETPPC